MSKVTIEKINHGTKDTKFGEKNSVGIKVAETQVEDINGNTVEVNDRWMNCLYDLEKKNGTEDWSEGDEVDIKVKVNGEYLNFQPGGGAPSKSKLDDLEARIKRLEDAVDVDSGKEAPAQTPVDVDDVDPDSF